ncbi:MAG: hypothetical protein Q9M21_02335, partial [Mariprofundaceae bacterium]|nr:hypothetical protein [Mariprofundaceae bacterium]
HPANGANPDKHTRTYKDGAVIEYDSAAHHLKAILPSGSSTELVSDSIHFKGLLTLDGDFIHNGNETKNGNTTQTGNITSSAAIASVSMTASSAINGASVAAGSIDLAAHTHGGVATGLGNTGAAKP